MLTLVLLVTTTASELLLTIVTVPPDIMMMELPYVNNVTILVKLALTEMLVPLAKI
jgi:hypothetical protein